jgi:hypothetical protein
MLKRSLALLGMILVGALGSGLWSLLQPPAGSAARFLLSAATLGLESIRDKVYSDAAMGHHELSSLMILLLFSGFLAAIPISLPLAFYFRKSLLPWLLRPKANDTDSHSSRSIILRYNKRRRIVRFISLAIMCFCVSCISVQSAIVNQQNLIYTYYTQNVTIIRPYITENDFHTFNARYARMKTKHEYIELIQAIEHIGDQNGISLERRETW